MKSILLISLTTLFMTFSAGKVSACWCRTEVADTEVKFRRAVAKAVSQSHTVFLGEIIEQRRSQIRVKVERMWKGKIAQEIVLVTHDWDDGDVGSIDSCAFPFLVGRKYLIFAEKDKGELVVSKCSRTKLLNEAERDLMELTRSRATLSR